MSIGGMIMLLLFIGGLLNGFIQGVKHDADAARRREINKEAKLNAYEKYYK